MDRRKSRRGMSKELFTILICLACQICISSSSSSTAVPTTPAPTTPAPTTPDPPTPEPTTPKPTTLVPTTPEPTTVPTTTIGPDDVKPTGVTVDAINTTSVNVTWVAATTAPVGTTYTVTTSATNGGTEPTINPSAPTSELSQLISGLGPGHRYSFILTGTKDAVSGAADAVLQNTKPGAVHDIVFSDIRTTRTRISWKAPATGIVSSYNVTVQRGGSSIGELCDGSSTGSTKNRDICELRPGARHTFNVAAVSGSETGAIMTDHQTLVPLPPSKCGVTAVNDTAININIVKNSSSEVNDFFVTHEDEDVDNSQETVKIEGEGPHNKAIIGLTPGTTYTFRTVASADGAPENSTACTENKKTDLGVVSNIIVNATTEDTLTITYDNAPGKKDSYTVRCYPDLSDTEGSPEESTITCQDDPGDTCVCRSLTPGQRYKVSVTTVRAGFTSKTAPEGLGKTDLSKAQAIDVIGQDKTSLTINVTAGPGKWENFRVSCLPGEQTTTCTPPTPCLCEGLTPGEKYTVRATTVRQGFTEVPSDVQAQDVTVPTSPIVLNVTDNQEENITITWSPPAAGTVFHKYKVYSQPGDQTVEITDISQTTTTLTGLDPNTEYSISITTISQHIGSAIRESSHTAASGESWTLPLPPVYKSPSRTKESLTVSWVPHNDDLLGVRGYMLQFFNEANVCIQGVRFSMKDVVKPDFPSGIVDSCTNKIDREYEDTLNLSYTQSDLKPYTNYSFAVYTLNPGGLSRGNHTGLLETDEAEPGEVNNATMVIVPSANELEVTWNPPDVPNGVIILYTVQWGLKSNMMTMNDNATVTNYIIRQLEPQQEYCVQVAAWTRIGQGPFSRESCAETEVKKPQQVLKTSIVFQKPNATSLTISWAAPTPSAGRTWYNVKLSETENPDIIQTHNTPVDGMTVTFDGLSPYWDYTVEIKAQTSAGTGPAVTQTDRTSDSSPEVVVGLSGEQAEARQTLTVTWKAPERRNQNGLIKSFIIKSTAAGDASRDDVTHTVTCNEYCPIDTDYSVSLSKIKHSSTYTITVRADTANHQGAETSSTPVPITTWPPNPPANETKDEPTKTVAFEQSKTTTTTLDVNLQCEFFTNQDNGPITERGLIINYQAAGAGLGSVPKVQWKDRHNKYKDRTKDGGPKWRWQFTAAPECGGQTGRRRLLQMTQTFSRTVGTDTACTETDTFCNGPLTAGTEYTIQSYACTNSHCQMTNAAAGERTGNEPGSPTPVAAIVAPIVVVICLALVIVAAVIFMRRRNIGPFDNTRSARGVEMGASPGENAYENVAFEQEKEPEPIEKHRFTEHVKKYHKDTDLLFSEEYKLIKERCGKYPWTAADLPVNRNKNRYTNILPYDHSRVKLLPTDDDEGSDYINANYMPGYNSRREFIAAQGPLPGTVDDFWRMVWEQNVTMIIMLTQCMEKGKPKCEQYWPKDEEPHFIGDLQVQIRSESVLNTYTIRVLDVKLGGQNRQIKQFHFTVWPDFGCPKTTGSVIEFVSHVRTHMKPDSKGPCIVHCSAGVGRTGTFIAVDRLIQHIRDYTTIDIYHLVMEMREHRCNMVQTEDQYIYIHDCMKDAIEQAGNEARNGSTQNEANGSVAEKSV